MPVEDAVIVERLKALLSEVDMATTTERKLRQTLEAELGEDLSERKPLIRKEVQSYLEQTQEPEEDGVEEEGAAVENGGAAGVKDEEEQEEDEQPLPDKPKRKRRAASAFGSILSEAMQEFLGQESMPRTEVVKRLWAYIKEHELQDPKNKRKIRCDAALLKLFKPPLDMFKMNKQLSKHVFAADRHHDEPEENEEEEDDVEISEEEDDFEEEDEEETPAKKKKAAAPRKREAAGSGSGKSRQRDKAEDGAAKPKRRRTSSGGQGGCELSPEMQAFLGGVPRMPRPQVVKAVWDYIKEHSLQDPRDKRSFLPDAKLATILTPPVNMFSMNKQLSKHVFSASQE